MDDKNDLMCNLDLKIYEQLQEDLDFSKQYFSIKENLVFTNRYVSSNVNNDKTIFCVKNLNPWKCPLGHVTI